MFVIPSLFYLAQSWLFSPRLVFKILEYHHDHWPRCYAPSSTNSLARFNFFFWCRCQWVAGTLLQTFLAQSLCSRSRHVIATIRFLLYFIPFNKPCFIIQPPTILYRPHAVPKLYGRPHFMLQTNVMRGHSQTTMTNSNGCAVSQQFIQNGRS